MLANYIKTCENANCKL